MNKNIKCSPLAKFLDKTVSFYAFASAGLLVVYMIMTFVVGAWDFFSNFQINFLAEGLEKQEIEIRLLAFISFTIVLIKAYRILISYAKTQHVNIKYLTEIAIIAPAIEVVFNSYHYKLSTLIVIAVFGLANLVIYVWHYDKFKEIGEDENKEPL